MVEPVGWHVAESRDPAVDQVVLTDENDGLRKHGRHDGAPKEIGPGSEYISKTESDLHLGSADSETFVTGMEMRTSKDLNDCEDEEGSMTESQLRDVLVDEELNDLHLSQERSADSDTFAKGMDVRKSKVLNDCKDEEGIKTVSQLHNMSVENESNDLQERSTDCGTFRKGMEVRTLKDLSNLGEEEDVTTVSVNNESNSCEKSDPASETALLDSGVCECVTDSSEVYDHQVSCDNSGNWPSKHNHDNLHPDETDADPTIKTTDGGHSAINVISGSDVPTSNSNHSMTTEEHSRDNLMTVSQLYEASRCQVTQHVSERDSVNFDGMTVSQLPDAADVLEKTQIETADCLGASEDLESTEVVVNSDGDGSHSNQTLATGGRNNEEEETHVTERPEAMHALDVDTRQIHKHDDHDEGTSPSPSAACGSLLHLTSSEAGGYPQDAALVCKISDSSTLDSAQVDKSVNSGSPSLTDMLCVSQNPPLNALRTLGDNVVGDLNAFHLYNETESHSPGITDGLNTETLNLIHNNGNGDSINCSEHVESHTIEATDGLNSPVTSQERNEDLIKATYLVSGQNSIEELEIQEETLRNPPTVIKVPQNGISGTSAITDLSKDLHKDFDNFALSTSTNKAHAKFLRLYDQIDLDDKSEVCTESDPNLSELTKDIDSRSEGYGTVKRNGSLTSTVRLRRQKSSPDPGRRGLNGSPLMRVKGIIIDDVSSNDSDSPRCSEDSEDEDDDAGIYADSYRMSRWLYLGETDLSFLSDIGNAQLSRSGSSSPSMAGTTSSGTCGSLSDLLDDPLTLEGQEGQVKDLTCSQEILSQSEPKKRNHRRSESISTTASEVEFRLKYKTKTRRTVQRKSSMQLYQRISEKYLDEGRVVTIEKLDEDTSFGFHIKDSAPVIVSTVEEGSPAHRGGLQVGDVLIAVNEVNVLEASHQEVVKLMAADTDRVKLRVAADRLPDDAPLCCGYLTKQGGSGILKNWRRRWFVLKQDHCLYYYKSEEDKDPLGAILLSNYTITKAPEINRKFVFKASKYGQRTYYFQSDSEEDMNGWASAMATAADVSNKKDTWLDVSSHNVGLPALAIKQPDCHGHLTKMGVKHKTWKRRYCVLKDACLYYYMDVSSSTAQGVAHLHGYKVEDSLPFNKKFGFMVVPPDKNLRTFYFSADNETDKKRWMDALQKSISRWVRADEA